MVHLNEDLLKSKDPTRDYVSHVDPAHHVTPKSIYFVIFGILMILTAVTYLVSQIDLGRGLNTAVAMAIAVSKATLVILYFMHVRYSTRLTWVIVIGSFVWLGVLFVLTFSDYVSRGWSVY
ncbi:MAG TPA: cytochrome C oxidase subunit IV family protein [Thermoanaerobaculia bacterium]